MRLDIPDKFLLLFTKVFENKSLDGGNRLNAFMLRITNNSFNYNSLKDELENAMITYALSRHTYDELVSQKNLEIYLQEHEKSLERQSLIRVNWVNYYFTVF